MPRFGGAVFVYRSFNGIQVSFFNEIYYPVFPMDIAPLDCYNKI